MNMEFLRKLPVPKDIKEQYPLDDKLKKIKAKRDEEISAVFGGESERFVLIIGPCSADSKSAMASLSDFTKRRSRCSLVAKLPP